MVGKTDRIKKGAKPREDLRLERDGCSLDFSLFARFFRFSFAFFAHLH